MMVATRQHHDLKGPDSPEGYERDPVRIFDDNPFGSLWVGELVGQSILRRGILRSKMDIGPGDATSDLDLRVC